MTTNPEKVTWTLRLCLVATLLLVASPTQAQLVIPGADGSDGVFAPTVNTNIDLALAPDGTWNGTNASPGRGVYDPEKWAVVFRYSSVNIPGGVTVTFSNHRSGAPVVWLVSSNVTINGAVSLNGGASSTTSHSRGGPGGFRGTYASPAVWGIGGFGPGGGNYNQHGAYSGSYGNARIVPLIGGSGAGQGEYFTSRGPGTGGGGALLLASAGTVSISGTIRANGQQDSNGFFVGGSGGAVRIIGNRISGSGLVTAQSATLGRIRLETLLYAGTVTTYPFTAVVPPDEPVMLWPPDNSPQVRVVSIGGQPAPADPGASLSPPGGDVNIGNSGSVQVLIEGRNLATNATMTVRVTPTVGNPATVNAVRTSGDFTLSQWSATVSIAPSTYAAIQVRAVGP